MDFENNNLPEDMEPTPAEPEESSLPEEPLEEPEAEIAEPQEGEPVSTGDPTYFGFGVPTRVPGGMQKRSNGFAIASLICAILSIPCCCCGYFGILLGAAGIVCAIFDRVKHGRFSSMALAGLIVGIVGVCLGIGMLILSLVAESLLIQMIEDGTIPKEMIQDLVDQGVIAPEDVPEGILDPATTTTSLFTPGGNL